MDILDLKAVEPRIFCNADFSCIIYILFVVQNLCYKRGMVIYMCYKIGVVTGTRAEYGLLKPLIDKIFRHSNLELCLIVTGMHLEPRFGNTYLEIETDGYPIAYHIPMKLCSDEENSIVNSMGIELTGFGNVLKDAKLDMMIVLGDRFEAFIAAVAATIFRIPIAHVHGGDVTEGLIDEALRHSITKMSSVHFPATEVAAKRIIQMGEQPSRVYNVGALGVENIKNCKLYNRIQLSERFGQLFLEKYVMVTYHPVTLESNTAGQQFKNLLKVFDLNNDLNYIFTYANADPNGNVINVLIDEYVSSHKNAVVFKSMGQIGYLSSLQFCEMVIGNSSSGIVEAPSLGIPTVNIGDRQKGRVKAESIINCGYSASDISKAFDKAESDFKEFCRNVKNPYEGRNTSGEIIETIEYFLEKGIEIKKEFYDL